MKKSPGIAVILSFIVPGGGSMYAESVGKGILYFISIPLFFVIGMLALDQGEMGAVKVFMIIAILLGICSTVSAYNDAKRFNLKKEEEENEGSN
jgi:TM2 domain-containing membrane protein YozV